MASTPTRIDDELYEVAKLVGAMMSRSAAQQITHWARIGREIESAEGVSARAIGEVLARRLSYDSLSDEEQAVVRAEWASRLDERRKALDIPGRLEADGHDWAELGDDGRVVEHRAAARKAPPEA